MDGLECSEIQLSMLDTSGRIDPEFYKKRYLKDVEIIQHSNHKLLSAIADFVVGPFGSAYDTNNYVENPGFRYIRGQDVQPFILNYSSPKYMSEKDYKRLSRYALQQDDILVSVVGTIGNACIITSNDVPAIFSCKSTAIRSKAINPYFLVTFLNSKYGHDLLSRRERGAVQKGINLEDLKSIAVPSLSDGFQSMIEKSLKMSGRLLNNSQNLMALANQILNAGISLPNESSSTNNISIRFFSESFGKTGRLDAEYYQKKYDELLAFIKKGTYSRLIDLADISKSIEPGSKAYCDDGIPFIRISDFSKYGFTTPDKYLEPHGDYDLPELYLKKDEILFSKDGSIGIAYKVEQDTKAITSGALLHLKIKKDAAIIPDYLTAVLNSDVVHLQAERDAGGSIINHWKPSEIEEILIPILPINKQQDISAKIVRSFALKHKSEQLLETAKQAVEMAIEKDEEVAIRWLNERRKEIENIN